MKLTKICGIKDVAGLQAAIKGGANFIGFVFYPPSPRSIEIEQAKILSRHVPTGIKIVGLFVNPSDAFLQQVVPIVGLDMIQLHGHESPVRVQEIKGMYGLKVMKAISISDHTDLNLVKEYEAVADWLLFDTKSAEYGGTGRTFDWNILTDIKLSRPWMLAGGLNVDNVVQALSVLKPNAIDVSSGVEECKGVKSPQKIIEFLTMMKKY